jgi:hypothetical protein
VVQTQTNGQVVAEAVLVFQSVKATDDGLVASRVLSRLHFARLSSVNWGKIVCESSLYFVA